MITLFFEVKANNGEIVGHRKHETTEENMIELMGNKENYIEYVKERYIDEFYDEYDMDVNVEFMYEE